MTSDDAAAAGAGAVPRNRAPATADRAGGQCRPAADCSPVYAAN